MADPRADLQNKFADASRHANFGEALMQMHVQGFRCHANTLLDIKSPITAFCGHNGTGKSTLLQLAALSCKSINGKVVYVSDFFVDGRLDPAPYRDNARIVYKLWQDNRSTRPLTLSKTNTSWSGYKRRATKEVFFAGVGMYLPKVERRDFSVYRARALHIDTENDASIEVVRYTCNILGHGYETVRQCNVSCGRQSGSVIRVGRNGSTYSEAHMGFGEGRAAYLVEKLETIPNKSLVLIEEPETSLHPSAQHRLGMYFINVSARKGHQILISTHSEYLLRALPSQSIVYLYLDAGSVKQLRGLTASQASSLMADGNDRALTILVEDECAKCILIEMIRQRERELLPTIHVAVAGDVDSILTTMRSLQDAMLPVAAVLDGDMRNRIRPRDNIFALPGAEPPEREMLAKAAIIDFLSERYGITWADFRVSQRLDNVDHHEWIPRLANQAHTGEQSLTTELARVYADTENFGTLLDQIKAAVRR